MIPWKLLVEDAGATGRDEGRRCWKKGQDEDNGKIAGEVCRMWWDCQEEYTTQFLTEHGWKLYWSASDVEREALVRLVRLLT